MLKRINTLVISVVVLSILATGLTAFQVINRYNDRINRDYLESAATMIELALHNGATAQTAAEEALTIFDRDQQRIRITIIDRSGSVLFDNEANASQMENHLFRPEIASAIQNGLPGVAVRRSQTLHVDMLYLAIYSPDLQKVIRTAMPLDEQRQGLAGLLTSMIIVLGAALIILIVVGAFLVRRISRPLIELKLAAQGMSEGNYEVRVRNFRDDSSEISALSAAFNLMAEKLQVNVRELEDRNARLDAILDAMTVPLLVVTRSSVVTFMNSHARETFGRNLDPEKSVYPLILITHHPETEKLVQKALDEGRTVSVELTITTVRGNVIFNVSASPVKSIQSDRVIVTFYDVSQAHQLQKMRSEFVANVTHELRTPLTSIRGFIETLRNGAVNNPVVAERFLEIIDIEAERLHKLISDILVLSEIEDLKEDTERETFDMNALIDDVAVLLDDAATEKKVSIIPENDFKPIMVTANRHRIKQILINLVDNAVKYNLEGGKVFINAHRQGDGRLCVMVLDTGVGIAPEHLDRLFERFYRVDASRSRELGGTGLGLSIVKHIAQLYGGYARVESQLGSGTTFTIVLDI
jgi:two-component system phosphate regulon sensor histidine kinase PhoR